MLTKTRLVNVVKIPQQFFGYQYIIFENKYSKNTCQDFYG